MSQTTNDTKKFLQDLFVHDTAVKQEIGRAAAAIGYGLNPYQYSRPFPGSTTVNISEQQPPAVQPAPSAPRSGLTEKALLSALLLGGGGLAGWLASHQGGAPALPVAPGTTISTPKGVEWEIRWKMGPDGKWIVEREAVK